MKPARNVHGALHEYHHTVGLEDRNRLIDREHSLFSKLDSRKIDLRSSLHKSIRPAVSANCDIYFTLMHGVAVDEILSTQARHLLSRP